MGLQRQRFIGGEHLDQEGKSVAEPMLDRRPEFTRGVGRDGVEKRDVSTGALEPGRIAGMGTEPQFGFRMGRRRRSAGELGDRGT
jgi:hypothetical protein